MKSLKSRQAHVTPDQILQALSSTLPPEEVEARLDAEDEEALKAFVEGRKQVMKRLDSDDEEDDKATKNGPSSSKMPPPPNRKPLESATKALVSDEPVQTETTKLKPTIMIKPKIAVVTKPKNETVVVAPPPPADAGQGLTALLGGYGSDNSDDNSS